MRPSSSEVTWHSGNLGSSAGRRASLLCAVLAGLALLLSGAESTAGTIFFSSLDNDAASVNFGTIPGHGVAAGAAVPGFTWNYSGNYADPRSGALHASFTDHICIGPGGACGSNNNDGVAGDEYTGYEYYYFTFSLPSTAANVRLLFEDFDGDDRAVLGVNGTQIGGFKSTAAAGGTTITTMKDASGNHTVLFQRPPVPAITNQSLFHAGENHFSVWVNNTFSGLSGNAIAHAGSFDPSVIRLRGAVTFDTATVPEPTVFSLFGLGLAWLGLRVRGRRD